jgi:hypothetical protein
MSGTALLAGLHCHPPDGCNPSEKYAYSEQEAPDLGKGIHVVVLLSGRLAGPDTNSYSDDPAHL